MVETLFTVSTALVNVHFNNVNVNKILHQIVKYSR